MSQTSFDRRSALSFVIAFGIVSFFGDMAYEGMRGLNGPFLAALGASGTAVGVIAGGGELIGYLLRLASGRLAQRTGAYWPMSIAGYALTMISVPAMAFVVNWQSAALFVILERAGKAIRSPANNTMQSRAGDHIGQGWAFGLQEALDQAGAIGGPLITALVLARHGDYRAAYSWLAIPAALTMVSVGIVAMRYKFAGHVARPVADEVSTALSRAFWFYTASASLLGFGIADFSLIAFHFAQAAIVSKAVIPIFYAVAMACSGLGALVLGMYFDRHGLITIVPVILLGAAATPLVFLGHWSAALLGTALWGVTMGSQTALMSASVARLVPENMRAHAYGLFSAIYGTSWFVGSALLGVLYDYSFIALAIVAIVAQLASIVPLLATISAMRKT